MNLTTQVGRIGGGWAGRLGDGRFKLRKRSHRTPTTYSE